MTVEQFAWGLGLFISVSGALWAIWWRIDGKMSEAKSEVNLRAEAAGALATTVRAELSDYKLHVAETFVTKQGQREQTETMLVAINGIRTDIKGLNDRIDRLFENHPKRTRSSQ